MSPFLDKDGRIIVIEPYSFTTALGRITADVAKVNTVGKSGRDETNKYDFYMDMKNKDEADRIILGGFDISRSFFCFSMIGRIKKDDLKPLYEQIRGWQGSKVVLGYVLSARRIGEKYYLLCIAGKEYVGSIYVRDEAMPSGDKKLEGRVVNVLIAENRKYKTFEAFYIELSEERIPNDRVKGYFRDTETDFSKKVIKGVIKEIGEDNVSIDSETFRNFTARWGDPLRLFSPHKRYRKGNEVIAFVNYSKRQEDWFVECIEKM